MRKRFIFILFFIINFLFVSLSFAQEPVSGAAKKNTIIVKVGTFTLADTDQTLAGTNATFEDTSSSVLSVEYNRKFGDNFAFGGEMVRYTNEYVRILPGEVDTLILMGVIKKYFALTTHFQPFIGVGVGVTSASVTGSLDGNASGTASSFSVGAEIPFDYVGIHLEYKYLNATADNETILGQTAKFDLSGTGFFAGVAIHF